MFVQEYNPVVKTNVFRHAEEQESLGSEARPRYHKFVEEDSFSPQRLGSRENLATGLDRLPSSRISPLVCEPRYAPQAGAMPIRG